MQAHSVHKNRKVKNIKSNFIIVIMALSKIQFHQVYYKNINKKKDNLLNKINIYFNKFNNLVTELVYKIWKYKHIEKICIK
jgi:heme/copper-type cytochrome/quinol oxidase subunit 4